VVPTAGKTVTEVARLGATVPRRVFTASDPRSAERDIRTAAAEAGLVIQSLTLLGPTQIAPTVLVAAPEAARWGARRS
jgi:hypothetical protein